jgi:hypothetical protein
VLAIIAGCALSGVPGRLAAGSVRNAPLDGDVPRGGPVVVAQDLAAIPKAVDPWEVLAGDPPARLELETQFLGFDADCQAAFQVTVKNSGDTDVFIHLGSLLNGGRRQVPDALRARIETAESGPRDYHWAPYAIGGTLHQALVPLRSGSTHGVRVRLADLLWFLPPASFERFVPGTPARVSFVLRSIAWPGDRTLGIVNPPMWIGELVSPSVELPACP